MKFSLFLVTSLAIHFYCMAQVMIPAYYKQSKSFTDSLKTIIHDIGLGGTYDAGEDGKEQISFAVIDLTGRRPVLGGVNFDNFIYPASIYKMYVAMEILKQVSNGEYSLFQQYIVRSPNDVDKSAEISFDPRPLLKNQDTVTINYLLDLMITRSDNSAANCLIDVATRNRINKTMKENGWQGSEVTRKFLKRKYEDPGYDTVRSTETCALHAADFMYKIYNNQLVNPWVSMQMLSLNTSDAADEDGKEQISVAVIDLTGRRRVFGGVNFDNFTYPASVYKMYVAMEILKQVSNGEYSLFQQYIVRSPNDVDKSAEISYDPRPLLKNQDTVTINYLLDLMITRSDNSAANCLIDVATRNRINKTMKENGWQGSEVTRKFLKRKYEDPGYDTVRSTETCALHAADFMYKIYNNQLVNPWVSMQMKALLGRQLDTTKLSTGLPTGAMFYHKTGWWSIYTNDVGMVEDGKIKYIISVFTPVAGKEARPKLKELSRRVYNLIKARYP